MVPRVAVCATLFALLIAGCKPAASPESQSQTGAGPIDGAATASNASPTADHPPTQHEPPTSGGPQLGSATLDVVDAAGYQAVLDKQNGKVVLVDFWATWCIPCRQKFPHNVELARKYADKGLAVISVSMDDPDTSKEDALTFLQQQHADFPNLMSSLGAGSASMEAFDIDGGALPHYKLYSRQGALIKKFVTDDKNEVESAQVEAEVRKALGLAAE